MLTVTAAFVGGCGSTSHGAGARPDAVAGAGAVGGDGGESGSSASGGDATAPPACEVTSYALPKRLVRLSLNQIANAVENLTDAVEGAKVAGDWTVAPRRRAFPPLASPLEGSFVTDSSLKITDSIANEVGQYLQLNATALTDCGETPSEACVADFVGAFAERAYRRPLTDDEQASLQQVVTGVLALGDPPSEALRYGVYAALESPQFLYRSELGSDAQAEQLTPHEIASELSFFVTDTPPDQPLLDAAASDQLATSAQRAAQVARLLSTPAAKKNLESALYSYFDWPRIDARTVDLVIDGALSSALTHEADAFLAGTLWSGPLSGMLTSRQASINALLAPIYGVTTFPPAGVAVDAQGFALVDLPATRAGLLTLSSTFAAHTLPNEPPVIARGLFVNEKLLCTLAPLFPSNVAGHVTPAALVNASEREKAEARATTAPCGGCHGDFDPYGLALDNFGLIGLYRRADAEGRPIDATTTLPVRAGGANVTSAAEMAEALATGPAFEACMASRLLTYALAELPQQLPFGALTANSCAVQDIAGQFRETDKTFADLVTQVASSDTLVQRSLPTEPP